MKYLSQTPLNNSRVLLRTDYNVALTKTHSIADDNRIRASLPTIQRLLSGKNRVIIISHLGRPEGTDSKLSLEPVRKALEKYIPGYNVILVTDFKKQTQLFKNQTANDILLLENIRFHKEEEQNDHSFAKDLSYLGDIYVNDAFSVSHRASASIVGIPKLLPSLAGLSLEGEFEHLSSLLTNPKHPFTALIGGGKISTKLSLLESLLAKVDKLLLGGGLATTCLQAKGLEIGKSISEPSLISQAKNLVEKHQDKLVLPVDVIVENIDGKAQTRIIHDIQPQEIIRDIGPQTITLFSEELASSQTILWNGPVGFFEIPPYGEGTEKLYNAIIRNKHAVKIVGGGDSLAALSKFKDFQKQFTHVSTGGGAMLEFLEKGTLPGIEALGQTK